MEAGVSTFHSITHKFILLHIKEGPNAMKMLLTLIAMGALVAAPVMAAPQTQDDYAASENDIAAENDFTTAENAADASPAAGKATKHGKKYKKNKRKHAMKERYAGTPMATGRALSLMGPHGPLQNEAGAPAGLVAAPAKH